VGAWIEIKYLVNDPCLDYVAPRVGAWIEIRPTTPVTPGYFVAPRVGAWIEMVVLTGSKHDIGSLPVWERGLKFFQIRYLAHIPSLPVWERGLK